MRTHKFLKNYFSKISIRLLLLLIVFIGAIALFVLLMHEVLGEKEEIFDLRIFAFINEITNPKLTVWMKIITCFASSYFLLAAYILVILIYSIKRNWEKVIEIFVIGAGGFLINYFMKISFHRVRPTHPLIEPLKNFSFPSGHATSGFIFYGLLVYLIWKTNLSKSIRMLFSVLLILFALLIGFSRIYLRVHFASDVLAGFCIGTAWIIFSIWIMEAIKKKQQA